MKVSKDFDVWKVFIITFLLADGVVGRPRRHKNGRNNNIVKRVEISGAGTLAKSQVASRRQNVIHAGEDYESDDNSKPEVDDLENLGKIVDYDGKVIESNKPSASKWKDTAAISKDVIERIKEIQESLIKRSGGKNLAEKLKLLQPEKNITVATTDSNGVTSRKVIPEDVVNKIIEKFQELRSQASELAKLDQRAKSEQHESEKEAKNEKEGKKEETTKEPEKPKKEQEKNTKAVEANTKAVESKDAKPSSPYESIGPPKENEEVRNITQHSISESQMSMPGNQEVFKASNAGPVAPEPEGKGMMPNNMMMQKDMMMQKNVMMQKDMMQPQQQNNAMLQQNMMSQNTQGGMMMMQGKVPMMFIKSGQMLVPVFGGQNGPMFGNSQNGPEFSDRGVDGRSNAPYMQTQQDMMGPPLVPQQPAIESGQSRSGPQLESRGSAGGVQIPSVPYSLIMSLMSAPRMMTNLPAPPPQMNGIFNVPQDQGMSAMGFMRQPSPAMSDQANGDQTGFSRSFGPGQQSMPEGDQAPDSMGGPPGQMSPMLGGNGPMLGGNGPMFGGNGPMFGGSGPMPGGSGPMLSGNGPMSGGSGPLAVSMDMSGRLSMLNQVSAAFPQQQGPSPLTGNPFQDTHSDPRNGLELFDKDRQMLNPVMTNPVNDLSDPMEGPGQASLRNINPDSLLELAKMRSTESENPAIGDPRTLPRDPDTLLDTLHMRQLNRGLSGPGDPERAGMKQGPAMHSPFDGTNPESLLDMLSKRKSNDMRNKDVMEWERAQENQVFSNLKSDKNAFGRGQISEIGTNGMQSVSSLPTPSVTGVDPSFADVVGNQPFDIANRNSAGDNPVESSFFRQGGNNFNNGNHNSISVVSHDDLRYENSKNAIDSGEGQNPINQADVFVRHKIFNPNKIGSKRSKTASLHDDNVELKVNGKILAETGTLRSKIVNGKVKAGRGKTLTSKSPVRIELSHSNDAKKTKVVNIITTGKFKVTESRRDKITKKGDKKEKNILRKFYRGS